MSISPRNLFESDNARYLSHEEIVDTFIPTKSFWRLLSPKNHIVLGARGSGKTAIARMLAHPQLSAFPDKRAQEIIREKAFIGTYVPTKAEWIGGLKNKPWLDDREKEEIFRWRLNLATCVASLATIRSCLDIYVEDEIDRVRSEIELTRRLADDWFGETHGVQALKQLHSLLERLDFDTQQSLASRYVSSQRPDVALQGSAFHTELFRPLRRVIYHTSAVLNFPQNTMWMLCLDEAEALQEFHQKILNSFLRTHSDNLIFKLTTTPYGHYTLETNVGAGLSVGHDFEYVYIDRDFVTQRGRSPVYEAQLFRGRALRSGQDLRFVKLSELLGGGSPLLNPSESGLLTREEILKEIRDHGDPQLIRRVEELEPDASKLGNEILRKLIGAILLRSAVRNLSGQSEIDLYSGAPLIVRCSDGNPRRMIRIFNKLLLEGGWSTIKRGRGIHAQQISPRRQTQLIRDFSVSTLARVQAEPGYGRDLYLLLRATGDYMRALLHEGLLSTDQVTSINVDVDQYPWVWPLIQAGVSLGLLYPNIHPKNPDELPMGGTFHLAYVLCPAFYLMPRRGKPRSLGAILDTQLADNSVQLSLPLPPSDS